MSPIQCEARLPAGCTSVEELDIIDGIIRAIKGNSRVYVSTRAIPRADKLPAGYKADVGKITDILIGEALYSANDISVRELIQNARDACSRRLSQDTSVKGIKVVLNLDSKNRFFDVIDEGEGMTRIQLAESFSVIGASINDKYYSNMSSQNLKASVVGKFGVGFISTFMIAKRISISTVSTESPIHFEIDSPRLPFKYLDESSCGHKDTVRGTTIRIYLRDEFINGENKLDIISIAKTYCRHVADFYIRDDT